MLNEDLTFTSPQNTHFPSENKTPLSVTIIKTHADETTEASFPYIAILNIYFSGFRSIHAYFKALLKLQKITTNMFTSYFAVHV